MSKKWKSAINEDNIDISGMSLMQFAYLDSTGEIIKNTNGLIDKTTIQGTKVEKYFSLTPFIIKYKKSNVTLIVSNGLLTELNEPLLDENYQPLTI